MTPQKNRWENPKWAENFLGFFLKFVFVSPTQNPLQNQNSFAIKPQTILQNWNSLKLPEPRIKRKILPVSPKMETLSLSYSHSHASSILYTSKPLTATNQAFPLFLLPCTRSHSTNHLFCSSLHLHRPSPLRPCHASGYSNINIL